MDPVSHASFTAHMPECWLEPLPAPTWAFLVQGTLLLGQTWEGRMGLGTSAPVVLPL